jgi:hypothetical protein
MIYQYLTTRQKEPFSWSNNNCLAFVSGYLEHIGQEPLPEDWISGYDNPRSALVHYQKTLKKYGCRDIVDALGTRFHQELTLHPQDGTIVAKRSEDFMGHIVGLVCSDRCFFMSPEGLKFVEPEVTDIYWSTESC